MGKKQNIEPKTAREKPTCFVTVFTIKITTVVVFCGQLAGVIANNCPMSAWLQLN